jgi:membrane protein YqaA with SNARE-associated domain
MLYYAAMSTVGSVLGCLLIDVTLRPLGEKGLEKHLSARKLKRVQSKVRDKVGRAVAIASLIPPPFPFTAFVMAASALQYSRKRLLAIVGVTRMIRFTALGLLAMRFGERILKWSDNRDCATITRRPDSYLHGGSVLSVYGWIRRSR